MRFKIRAVMASALLCAAQSATAADVDVPYTEFTLENGLRVIVHEDHKAPIVAVNVWYHVGSKNEIRGKTGFAHLFEHLMFNGSENYDDEYFKPFEPGRRHRAERHDLAGPHQLLPERALDGRRPRAVDGIRPDGSPARRGRRRNGSTSSAASCRTRSARARTSPTAKSSRRCRRTCFPPDHPYSWETIGSMEDLNAASLEDVQAWFETYYGPNNAVLVLAGDITPEEARAKAERYFGDIPPGPPITKFDVWAPELEGEQATRHAGPRAAAAAVQDLGRAALDLGGRGPAQGRRRDPVRPARPRGCSSDWFTTTRSRRRSTQRR